MSFLNFLNQPLNTPGGLGKELKGNMQGKNIFAHLKTEYRGKPRKPGIMFEDSRVETNIICENTIQLFISKDNIKTIGGDNGDGIIETSDFLIK